MGTATGNNPLCQPRLAGGHAFRLGLDDLIRSRPDAHLRSYRLYRETVIGNGLVYESLKDLTPTSLAAGTAGPSREKSLQQRARPVATISP